MHHHIIGEEHVSSTVLVALVIVKKIMAVLQAVLASIIKPTIRQRMALNVSDVKSHVQPVEIQQYAAPVTTVTGVVIVNITATAV